jgi:YidC/Oxa1 family membrane protein insertase
MDKSQRIMLLILPVVFVTFLLNFPVGLVIYWVTTNLWTVGQGLITRRLMPKPAVPEKRSSRTAPKEAEVEPETEEPSEPAPVPTRPSQPRRVKRKRKARR